MRSILFLPAVLIVIAICGPAAFSQRRADALAYQVTYSATYDPSFSPDGKQMVYITLVLGKEQLFIRNLDGSGAYQLTKDDANHEDPAWSPDGKRIAFVYMKDGLEVISTINVDGSEMKEWTPRSIKGIHPNWHPDGTKLAYCTDDDLAPPRKNDADIMVIDMATGKASTLITGGVNTYPSFSPDGKRIAFRRMIGEMNSEVFIANADGSGAKNISNHQSFDGWPSWSPDGTRIAFASNRNSSYQIFTMSPDGTDVRLLANTEGRATAPQWGKDGQKIYFPICKNVDFGFACEIFVARTTGFVR